MFMGPFNMGQEGGLPRECLDTVFVRTCPVNRDVLFYQMSFKTGLLHRTTGRTCVPSTLIRLQVRRDSVRIVQVDTEVYPLYWDIAGNPMVHPFAGNHFFVNDMTVKREHVL